MKKSLAIAGLIVLSACQSEPTKTIETHQRELVQVVAKTQKPLELSDATVVLDARASFDYGLNKIQNSLNFPWQNLAEHAETGEVLRDKHQAALRLSLLGLTPETPVVVVGYGPSGKGEEGRLAWTLLYLGFQDVQVSTVETFRKTMTPSETPPARNEKVWAVNPRDGLQVGKAEFLKLTEHQPQDRVFIIDVRSAKEFKHKSGAINIEWKQFYTSQGRPDSRFVGKLKALGILPDDRVILVSDRGVRSGAAAYVLLALGFTHVQNFTGGWSSLN